MKSHALNFLSTRTLQLWPRTSLSAMCYEGILQEENFERQLEWLTRQENTESVSPLRHLQCSQDQARSSVRMLSNRAHVMPFHIATLQD